MLGWLKRRRMGDATQRRLTIALARAEEELIETHVQNVVDVFQSLAGDLPLPEVLDVYLDEMDPGERRAEIVTRRVLAQLEGARRERPRRRSADT